MKLEPCYVNGEKRPSELLLTMGESRHEQLISLTPRQARWLIQHLPDALERLKRDRARISADAGAKARDPAV